MARVDKPIPTGKTKLGKLWYRFVDTFRFDLTYPGGITINELPSLYKDVVKISEKLRKKFSCGESLHGGDGEKELFITVDFKTLIKTEFAYIDDDDSYDDDLRALRIGIAVMHDLKSWADWRKSVHGIKWVMRDKELFDKAYDTIKTDMLEYCRKLREKGYCS